MPQIGVRAGPFDRLGSYFHLVLTNKSPTRKRVHPFNAL
jgi:hypothetical protein